MPANWTEPYSTCHATTCAETARQLMMHSAGWIGAIYRCDPLLHRALCGRRGDCKLQSPLAWLARAGAAPPVATRLRIVTSGNQVDARRRGDAGGSPSDAFSGPRSIFPSLPERTYLQKGRKFAVVAALRSIAAPRPQRRARRSERQARRDGASAGDRSSRGEDGDALLAERRLFRSSVDFPARSRT